MGFWACDVTQTPSFSLVGTLPGRLTVITDPAGIQFIMGHGPAGAGGAARDTNHWLSIQHDAEFHSDVKASITRTGQIKYRCYIDRSVIHVAAPVALSEIVVLDVRRMACVKAGTWQHPQMTKKKAAANYSLAMSTRIGSIVLANLLGSLTARGTVTQH